MERKRNPGQPDNRSRVTLAPPGLQATIALDTSGFPQGDKSNGRHRQIHSRKITGSGSDRLSAHIEVMQRPRNNPSNTGGAQEGRGDHTLVAAFLGQAVANALLKGQSVCVTNDVAMTLESGQTFRPSSGQGLLAGAHISIMDMNRLDNSWGAQAIMYLPWTDIVGQEWQETWHPETVGPKTQNAPPSSLPKPEEEEALLQLTKGINLGTGLGHPSDKRHAERTIDNLRAGGHPFDPAEFGVGRSATAGALTRRRNWKRLRGRGGSKRVARISPALPGAAYQSFPGYASLRPGYGLGDTQVMGGQHQP